MTLPENNTLPQSPHLSDEPANSQSPSTYPLLALILSIFVVAPLFYPGYFQTHSGFTSLWHLADLRANSGWLWTPPDFDPLRSAGLFFYHLAAVLPVESISAIKIIIGLSWLLGSLGMYGWLKNWLGQPGALVAALIYTYLPYRIATVYVRGAWAEAVFWGVLPWAIWACEKASSISVIHLVPKLSLGTRWENALRFAICVFPLWLILGLNQLGLTVWAFIFAMALILITPPRQDWLALLAALLGLGLAVLLTFGISASTSHPSALPHFSDHYLYPLQLLSAQWGVGPSRPGWNDTLSFQLGLAAVGLTILGLTLWLWSAPAHAIIPRTDRRMWFFIGAAAIGIWLQFGLTDGLWQLSQLAHTLTYPWQLLGLVGLCLAVLAGVSLRLDDSLTRLPMLGGLILLVILSVYPYLNPQFIQINPLHITRWPTLIGTNQLALLEHNFSVATAGNTAGLEPDPTTLPIATYGPMQANQTLYLNITWQPLQPLTEEWKVFAHLIDSNHHVIAQFDGPPQQGTYPTSQWIPGELIKDSYPLTLPANTPPGPYQVYLGLYNEATGARLPVPGDAEGRVILDVK